MKGFKIKKFTQEEIFSILDKYKSGVKVFSIAASVGRSHGSIYQIISNYKKFLHNETSNISVPLLFHFNEYSENNIKRDVNEDSKTTIVDNKKDSTALLEGAIENLIGIIIDISKEQVAEQHKQELQKQKEEYEKKLEHYQTLPVAAQDSNMVGFVKKRLGLS